MSAPAAADLVAQALRRAIVDGALPPGTRLREEALAAQHGVARHTVRAALRALAAARLVVVERNRGARVATLDGEDLRGLFDLRSALEAEAVRLLAESGRLDPPPGVVTTASHALARACAAAEREDSPAARAAVDAAHAALHHAVVLATGRPRLVAAHALLDDESRLALVQSRSRLPPALMADLHRRLLADLPVLGAEAVRRHLRTGMASARPDPSP